MMPTTELPCPPEFKAAESVPPALADHDPFLDRVLRGDAAAVLAGLPEQSVQVS